MAQINNSETIRELRKAAALQLGKDNVPTELTNSIVPVIEINPRLTRVTNILRSNNFANNTTATIYTTPSDQDFYLTGASLSFIKDATATSTDITLRSTINGAVRLILECVSLTLTADSQTTFMSFPIPIKIDRNVTITITSNTAVGNITVGGVIMGYVDEVSNA